jgi:hypothetical protein
VRLILNCRHDEVLALLAGEPVDKPILQERFERLMEVAGCPVPKRAPGVGNPATDVRACLAREKAAKAARVAALREANRQRFGVPGVAADSAR